VFGCSVRSARVISDICCTLHAIRFVVHMLAVHAVSDCMRCVVVDRDEHIVVDEEAGIAVHSETQFVEVVVDDLDDRVAAGMDCDAVVHTNEEVDIAMHADCILLVVCEEEWNGVLVADEEEAVQNLDS